MAMNPRLLRPTAGFLPLEVDYLVVAGGGGGGTARGGGGGAGGVLQGTAFAATAGSNYTVTVGSGGAGGTANAGVAGSASVFSSNSASGGGAGGSFAVNGGAGGSGGGGGASTTSRPGGTATAGQGNKGGDNNTSFAFASAGGGGAGAAAANVSSAQATDGGIGILSSITGTPTYYAGGGGGSGGDGSTTFAAPGGLGGGGAGTDYGQQTGTATPGTANTGGGGGGAAQPGGFTVFGGAGGSGVVILRYPRRYTPTISSSLTYDTNDIGPWRVLRFTTGSGYIAWNAPVVSNADAQDWIDRVYANGGGVSTSTAAAVNDFCSAIDAAGIRDRFYRLNLMCGTGLNAALVPLYRGPVSGGTTYGNSTDTNNGPFVSGDYSEASGLDSGATNSTKYLATGVTPDDIGTLNAHFSFYQAQDTVYAVNRRVIGILGAGNNLFQSRFAGSPVEMQANLGSTALVSAADSIAGLTVVDRQAADSLKLFTDGTERSTIATTVSVTLPTLDYFVYNHNNGGVPVSGQYFQGALRSYSLGTSLGDSGVAAYTSAMTAFQAALGREA